MVCVFGLEVCGKLKLLCMVINGDGEDGEVWIFVNTACVSK